MRLDELLARASARLTDAASPTPRLDAEVLLAQVLGRSRTWLYTWGDGEADPADRQRFEALIERRERGEPVAYLTGEREFWGLPLATTPATLIPRPDTESLVETALAKATEPRGRALDLGTGSGAIALAFASERPGWRVTGVDRVGEAVALAQANAQRLAIANAEFLESDWFAALADRCFDVILANPPYVAETDPHLQRGDVRFEPRSALVAARDGLADLEHLAATARKYLATDGWLLLEHGLAQGEAVRAALARAGFKEVTTHEDLAGHPRVSLGRRS
jgi:release factor glutamine methyltransferase